MRENAGTTLNLLEGCLEHGAGLVYPSTVRAGADAAARPLRRLQAPGRGGLPPAPRARDVVVRLTSVFGPGQVAWEGATGAIAAFAARALEREPIVIPGDPRRARDFVYVDDVVDALEALIAAGRGTRPSRWPAASPPPCSTPPSWCARRPARTSPIETPGGELAPGEDASYAVAAPEPPIPFSPRPLQEAIPLYVDWLRRHPAAQGRARA